MQKSPEMDLVQAFKHKTSKTIYTTPTVNSYNEYSTDVLCT